MFVDKGTHVTAKVELRSKKPGYNGQILEFGPDYADGRNKEWAAATPSLSLSMTVIDSVAEHFIQGEKYTLTFSKESAEDGNPTS